VLSNTHQEAEMFRTIAEFADAWKYESSSTLKIMQALTDGSLAQKVTPEGRSLGRLPWHVVQTLGEMGGQAGLSVDGANEKTPQPATAAAIAEAYKAGSAAVGTAVAAAWKDDDLPAEIDMYGEKWTRAMALRALIQHEVHHRGQMTVLMRQAGLKVPGIYGPAREEWATYGMPAHE
jgi:uncharacterized damage-inducible protein DinB